MLYVHISLSFGTSPWELCVLIYPGHTSLVKVKVLMVNEEYYSHQEEQVSYQRSSKRTCHARQLLF